MIGYDSDNLDAIPDSAQLVLYYDDGEPGSATPAQLARFPSAVKQSITRVYGASAYWADCEPGCIWPPARAAAMFQQGLAHGIYVDFSNWPDVESSIPSLHPIYWIAEYPIPMPTIPVISQSWIDRGCVMWQYASPDTGSPGHYDLSVTIPGFPTPPSPITHAPSLLLIGSRYAAD